MGGLHARFDGDLMDLAGDAAFSVRLRSLCPRPVQNHVKLDDGGGSGAKSGDVEGEMHSQTHVEGERPDQDVETEGRKAHAEWRTVQHITDQLENGERNAFCHGVEDELFHDHADDHGNSCHLADKVGQRPDDRLHVRHTEHSSDLFLTWDAEQPLS
jgi:hypothetical protein